MWHFICYVGGLNTSLVLGMAKKGFSSFVFSIASTYVSVSFLALNADSPTGIECSISVEEFLFVIYRPLYLKR